MKARGMLWRRVVDTSQEDRCDRRISTPVPSGLRSHHAFTALWKLLIYLSESYEISKREKGEGTTVSPHRNERLVYLPQKCHSP